MLHYHILFVVIGLAILGFYIDIIGLWSLEKRAKIRNRSNTDSNITSIFIYIYPTWNYLGPHGNKSKYAEAIFQCTRYEPGRSIGWKTMYESEQFFPKLLMSKREFRSKGLLFQDRLNTYITTSAEEADFFFVPHHGVCVLHQQDTKIGSDITQHYLLPLVEYIQNSFTFFKSLNGSRHIFMFTHDKALTRFGAEIARRLENSIILSTFGLENKTYAYPENSSEVAKWYTQQGNFYYTNNKNVVIPPIDYRRFNNEYCSSGFQNRKILAVFIGTIWPYNNYSGGVRQSLLRNFNGNFTIIPHSLEHMEYFNYLNNSKFLLCPGGWAPWSPRLFDALFKGIVPVIIADGIVNPFENFLNFSAFSVKVDMLKLYELPKVLTSISEENWNKMIRQGHEMSPYFSWYDRVPDMIFLSLARIKYNDH